VIQTRASARVALLVRSGRPLWAGRFASRSPSARYRGEMDRPPPDPAKLLAYWNEWETGETTPGRVMANLKTAGMPALLEQLVAATAPASPA
jgi:hypothetical protein